MGTYPVYPARVRLRFKEDPLFATQPVFYFRGRFRAFQIWAPSGRSGSGSLAGRVILAVVGMLAHRINLGGLDYHIRAGCHIGSDSLCMFGYPRA